MLYRLLLIPLFLLLGACQSTMELDYDPNRDFAAYRSWSWQEPPVRYHPEQSPLQSDLTEQRIREAVGQQLEQRGLRQASSGQADLNVQVWFSVERRQDSYTTYYGGMFMGYPGGWWGGPSYAQTNQYEYRVGILQVDLLDGHDGRLVWRGSDEQVLRRNQQSPSERAQLIRETAARVLSQYPPHSR